MLEATLKSSYGVQILRFLMVKFVYEANSSEVNSIGQSVIMAKDKYHDAVKKALLDYKTHLRA